ncbi:conjugal transfer protein TraO [Elizabethkingia anophelis]|uniref:conjugal transfer protein TraO n=1 Tax=Elizabethkingia anophelis TaxID=1117645 RepID=UPI0020B7F8DD|nr:conjugal transfer protein TraO [Elizabethkingia anophelis]UTG62096.1 conjugal transfer protein TraO [Elizabethkingia anophelis]UXM68363.1 conjugal transfer protein TraO [Elizabethkingia anophelis]
MYKIFLTVIFMLAMSIKTFAQQMIPKQKGVEFSYSVFPQSPKKQNYALNVGIISYARNGSYFFGLAEYGRKYYEYTNYEIPIEMFLFNGGYSFYLWGDFMRNVNLNLGIGGLVGYEQVNRGDEVIDDGSMLDSTDNFIYGVGGKLSFESYLTRHWVFLINGQLRFLKNSQQGQLHSLFGLGIRYNF